VSVHASQKKEARHQAQGSSEAQDHEEKGSSEAQNKSCKEKEEIVMLSKNSVLCAIELLMADSTEFLLTGN
jgi:hypothetical protein